MTHIVHFLSLLTFYLGVKMPFEVAWSGGKLGVGQPMISAIRGGESGGWARWYTKHSLHVSANPTSPTTGSSSSSGGSNPQSPPPAWHACVARCDAGPPDSECPAPRTLTVNLA